MTSFKSKYFINATILLCISAFCAILTFVYLRNEHFFQYWDTAFYFSQASYIAHLFAQNIPIGLKTTYLSTSNDYNAYYTIPILPFLWVSQYSRAGYVTGLVFVYYLPFLIISGLIAKRIFSGWLLIFWVSVSAGVLIPVLWASVLRGFPDIGATFLIAIAILVYLSDIQLKQWQWQLPLLGTFSALSIIFRRHFAYDVIALFFSIGVMGLIISSQKRKGNLKKIFILFLEYLIVKTGIILAIFVLVLTLFAPFFILRLFNINYLHLYSSYAIPTSQVAFYFFNSFGIVGILAIFGIGVSLYKQWSDTRSQTDGSYSQLHLLFIALFGFFAYTIWITIPRQADLHYMLHIAIPVVIGLTALAYEIRNLNILNTNWIMIVFWGLLGVNLWMNLTPMPLPFLSSLSFFRYPPRFRNDYEDVAKLISYLHTTANGKIYVADSSELMNSEILYYGEKVLYGDKSKLVILKSPEIDSRDFYPLELLLQADYIVITTPFQHHLPENEQKVVNFVFDAFLQNWPIAQDFEQLSEQFHLEGGAVPKVYRRRNPTSFQTTLFTFIQMQSYIDRFPGNQEDWIPIIRSSPIELSRVDGQNYSLNLLPDNAKNDAAVSLLFARPTLELSGLRGNVSFSNGKCSEILLALQQYKPDGTKVQEYTKILSTEHVNFSLPLETSESNTVWVLGIKTIHPALNVKEQQPCSFLFKWEWQGGD